MCGRHLHAPANVFPQSFASSLQLSLQRTKGVTLRLSSRRASLRRNCLQPHSQMLYVCTSFAPSFSSKSASPSASLLNWSSAKSESRTRRRAQLGLLRVLRMAWRALRGASSPAPDICKV